MNYNLLYVNNWIKVIWQKKLWNSLQKLKKKKFFIKFTKTFEYNSYNNLFTFCHFCGLLGISFSVL